MKLISLLFILALAGCATNSAPKLQAHLTKAQNASAKTTRHIEATGRGLDKIDYKANRAKRLLNEGIERPE